MSLEERVGEVEREQAKQGERITQLSGEVREANSGIKTLLERDARRPEGMTWKSLAAGATGLAAIAVVGWWLVGTSPVVQEIKERLTQLDHAQTGRVTRLEEDRGWSVKIQKGGR